VNRTEFNAIELWKNLPVGFTINFLLFEGALRAISEFVRRMLNKRLAERSVSQSLGEDGIKISTGECILVFRERPQFA
jgi:hypothetical protein